MGYQRKTPETFICKHCGTKNPWSYSSRNMFCSNKCQRDWEWEHKTKPRLLAGGGCASGSATLRRFLCEVHGPECKECGVGQEWHGNPLTLHVDHIDGNSDNNSVSNLRLLCPNCHSQTSTWCGRNTQAAKNTTRNRKIRKYYIENKDKWR